MSISVIKEHMPESHAHAVIMAAKAAGIPLAAACAMIEKESNGRNVYGHDVGGTYSTAQGSVVVQGTRYERHSDIHVTASNWSIFMIKVALGAKSNGVGPAQITYAGELPDGRTGGYFRQMLERGLCPWRPCDNMLFGFEILAGNYQRSRSWARAFGHYNGGKVANLEYGRDVWNLMQAWELRLP